MKGIYPSTPSALKVWGLISPPVFYCLAIFAPTKLTKSYVQPFLDKFSRIFHLYWMKLQGFLRIPRWVCPPWWSWRRQQVPCTCFQSFYFPRQSIEEYRSMSKLVRCPWGLKVGGSRFLRQLWWCRCCHFRCRNEYRPPHFWSSFMRLIQWQLSLRRCQCLGNGLSVLK